MTALAAVGAHRPWVAVAVAAAAARMHPSVEVLATVTGSAAAVATTTSRGARSASSAAVPRLLAECRPIRWLRPEGMVGEDTAA